MFKKIWAYVRALVYYKNQFFLFWLPNWKAIIDKRIKYKMKPSIQQFTICSGKGTVEIGDFCFFGLKEGGGHRGGSIEFQARTNNSIIKIGNKVNTNNNIICIAANYIEIGDNTLIGQNVTIMDHEAHGISPDKRREIGEIGSVIIEKNVWIGNNVIILKNSLIGENTIVASGCVVTGKFPKNVIIGGVPAKVIKTI